MHLSISSRLHLRFEFFPPFSYIFIYLFYFSCKRPWPCIWVGLVWVLVLLFTYFIQ
ncbi:hypothetical protein DFH27DRAFT_547210 [Peziza echinospora]|nr:hypothetical protein DFH27DRAFT_547210 [Peziza echinospora]